ncbi:uncharacterized protein [Pocillopora verrucosa]|uniref:uncharacterized protein isoform X3 n=1 Tax=Pocillopora verrucosa TaxID=203993 RepID=UPI0033413394
MTFLIKYIFVWIFLILEPTDGQIITWHEPTPAQTTENAAEKMSPAVVQVYEGSSVTLNWTFNLTSKLRFGVIYFNTDAICTVNAAGVVDSAADKFQQRFNVSSTTGKVSLFISPVTVGDDRANGEFRCELIDSIPKTWKRAILLEVIVSTNIIGIRGNRTVPEGDNLVLTCNASGRPEPNITWTKEKPGNQGNIGLVQEGKVLNITSINRTDAGVYTCTAYNGFGKPENRTINVNVTYPVKIVNFQTQYEVDVGQSVTLNCKAEGNPPPTYRWTPCNDLRENCEKNSFRVLKVCEDANYTCKVANGIGFEAKTANVFIEGERIFITINMTDKSCAGGKYSESLLLNGFDKVFREVFSHYERVEVRDNRCSTLKLALKFDSITNQTYVITSLRDAVKDGFLKEFRICSTCINGAASCHVTPTTDSPPHAYLPKAMKLEIIIIISLLSLLLVVVIGILCCWYFSTTIGIVVVFGFIRRFLRPKNLDSTEVHSNGGHDARMEAGYSSPDNQYAAAGPRANYRASNPLSVPSVTCEDADEVQREEEKHKSGELWSTFFGEKTGCGRVLSAGFTNPGFPGLGS